MLNNTYNTNYFNKNNPFTKSEPDYSQMNLREELEARFKQMEEAKQPQTMPSQPFVQPDYSKMSLREELEARFADQERQEQAKQQTMQSQPFSQPDYSQMSLADELRARLDEQERKQAAEQNLSIFPANSVLTSASLSGQPSSYTAATALPNPTSAPQPQMFPSTGHSAWDKFKSVAEPAYVGTQGALEGAYSAGKTAFNKLYQTGQSLGEFTADSLIAYQYYKDMNKNGAYLVNKLGSGAAADIDNYYHPLLQCQLAKISPESKDNGIYLGYGKEIYDYYKKRNNLPLQVILADSIKDLINNSYGSQQGNDYPNKSCLTLLDHLRTPNMKKEGIR